MLEGHVRGMSLARRPARSPPPRGWRLSTFRIKAASAIVVAAGLAVFGLRPGALPTEPSAVPFRQYASVPTETDSAPYAVATTLPQWRAFWPSTDSKEPPMFDPARHIGVAIPGPRDAARREEHVSVSSRGDRVVVVVDEPAHAAGRPAALIILRIDRPGAAVTVERRIRD